MPKCGSQCWLCDVPIRFDTYIGCSHGCRYCFASKKCDLKDIRPGEGVGALRLFVEGERSKDVDWADWDIPFHWGGMSDPFQPCERQFRRSYKCLEYLAESQYPFIVSTKGSIIAEEEYASLLEKCNCVLQISAVCSSLDKLEPGCPTYEERVEIIRKLSPRVKRIIVRIQPYFHEVYKEVYDSLPVLAEAGVYGVIIEGMKFSKNKPGLVKVGTDFTYPYNVIKGDFLALRDRAHEVGLKIYSGENRTRSLGDSLTCCGIDGLEGFKGNEYNLNHILNGHKPVPTKRQLEVGSAGVFPHLNQVKLARRKCDRQSFAEAMNDFYNNRKDFCHEVMGVNQK